MLDLPIVTFWLFDDYPVIHLKRGISHVERLVSCVISLGIDTVEDFPCYLIHRVYKLIVNAVSPPTTLHLTFVTFVSYLSALPIEI